MELRLSLAIVSLLAAASPAYGLRTAAPLVARPRLARSAPPVCAARPPRGGGGKNPLGDSAPLAAGAASLAALALGVGNLNALVGATIIAAVVAPEAFDKLGICCLSTASDVDSYCWEDHTRVRLQYYKECEDLLLSFFPGSTSAYVFDHELRDKERLREPNQVRPSLIYPRPLRRRS